MILPHDANPGRIEFSERTTTRRQRRYWFGSKLWAFGSFTWGADQRV